MKKYKNDKREKEGFSIDKYFELEILNKEEKIIKYSKARGNYNN